MLGGTDEGGEMVRTSSYEINKCWRPSVQHGDYSQQCCALYVKADESKS